VHTFNEMIDRIQSGILRIQQFSSDASHELRTPLTILRGEIEIALRKKRSGDEYKSVLVSLLEEVQRMEKIVDDLLFFTRADSGHIPLENIRGNLVEMIEENIRKMQSLAKEKTIDMSFHPGQSSIIYEIDPGKFSQLIANILDNAIKYTDYGGKIHLDIRQLDGQIRIEVEDNGAGIPEQEISKVFDRFYRVDRSRSSDSKSNGLGLSICKWIVEAYKGRILIKSEEGIGTTVIITLPE
ncbi:MAG: GHKL domain-containing protein, partial [Cyclobacteriaceae bacterium]|nr:GHKL domain-containing protein [Cyclobacteriaceae bacterium]